MKASMIVLFALVAVAASQSWVKHGVLVLLVRDDHGQYSYSYATKDGAAFSDHGALKQGPEGYVLVRQGSHAYTSPEGKQITLSYTADETGYHPTGDHLPVAPAPLAK